MNMNPQTTDNPDFELPEFELPETPVETPAVEPESTPLPEYVTRQDLESFAEAIASKLQPQAPTPAPTSNQDVYAEIGEMIYSDPAAAIKMAMEHARKETLAEVHQTYGTVALDSVTQRATRGMDPLEAEFVQMQVNEQLINPAALTDPKIMALIKPAAEKYAASKRATTPTPKAEEGVGASFRVTTNELAGQKATFERFFPGLKFEDAVKRANNI
jgi:hypothetical protein